MAYAINMERVVCFKPWRESNGDLLLYYAFVNCAPPVLDSISNNLFLLYWHLLQKDGKISTTEYGGQEVLCVRAYGSSFFGLGINIRSVLFSFNMLPVLMYYQGPFFPPPGSLPLSGVCHSTGS